MADIPVQSVRKAFDILSILAFEDTQRDGIALTMLANRLGLRINTAHNLLKSMCATGFVAQNAASKYVAGPKCLQIGRVNQLLNDAAVQRCRPLLESCSSRLNEAIVFVTMVNGKRVPLAMLDPVRPIKVDFTAIPDCSIYSMPTGRILVAYATRDERQLIVGEWGMPGAFWNEIDSHEALEEACQSIRAQGHELVAPDENDLFAAACPVLGGNGQLLGALGCYAPMFRCAPERQRQILRELLHTAEGLSHDLSALG